ncbi:MAG: Trm112 family protein [Ilumatobacteraceae bacterium]|nr:Trm112 family protein [Ilumatobacteraceae bacterium]
MSIDRALLDILACPQDKGALFYIEAESFLYNPRLHIKYSVRDGIPVMLINEAETVTNDENDRIMGLVVSGGLKPTFG